MEIVVLTLRACIHRVPLSVDDIGSITLPLTTRRNTPGRLLRAKVLRWSFAGERATARLGMGMLPVPAPLRQALLGAHFLHVVLDHLSPAQAHVKRQDTMRSDKYPDVGPQPLSEHSHLVLLVVDDKEDQPHNAREAMRLPCLRRSSSSSKFCLVLSLK